MNGFPSYLYTGIESKVNQRWTGNVKGTVKKSLIISFFLYGKQSKTSPVSTGDFSFPVNRGQYLHYQIQHVLCSKTAYSSFVNGLILL